MIVAVGQVQFGDGAPERLTRDFSVNIEATRHARRRPAGQGLRRFHVLPGTGRWQAEGLTEGAQRLQLFQRRGPLHHDASRRGLPPRSGEDLPSAA